MGGMGRRFGDQSRAYAKSHPWLTFAFRLDSLSQLDFVRVGEALSKIDHIAAVPLAPAVAKKVHQIYLAKGVHATTQIEGNTLSEDEVGARVRGELTLPESQEYLGKEVDNIVAACNRVVEDLYDGRDMHLTRARIDEFNAQVLDGLPLKEGVVPGKIRAKSVVVGDGLYRGAPSEDCEFLLDQLCAWLAALPADAGPDWSRSVKLIRAILAHLYIAWIHPFGDGNGRTARLIEFQLLLEAGVPTPACQLLSNYYNRTRQLYYQVLSETSRRAPYPVEKFVSYAIRGFVEELREQLQEIQAHQLRMAWHHFVHDAELGKSADTVQRRRDLAIALPNDPKTLTPIAKLRRLTTDLALQYAGKTPKTVTRDVNALVEAGLLVRNGPFVRPRIEAMLSLLPLRGNP
jgi:Fic family protein